MTSILIRWLANGRNRRYGQSRKIEGRQQDFMWRLEALDDMTRMKRRAEEKESEKANKKVMDYTVALNKVQAIRALNKQKHECTFSQTKTMVSWHKRIGDAPLPATLHLLTRYIDAMGCGDAPVTVARAILSPAASVEADGEDEVMMKNI